MDEFHRFNPEGSTLRIHQLRMLEILEVVDKICRKHHIKYWLSSGTLLGAVRHKGFIPWDDDLDIEMLRPDYVKLLRILPDELPANLRLQTSNTDKNYVAPYAKVRDLDSRICETANKDQNYKYRGIYIDIFYLEPINLPFVRLASKLHGHLYRLSYRKNDMLGFLYWIKRLFFLGLTEMAHPVFRFLSSLSPVEELRLCMGAGFFGVRKREELFPLKEISFEGKLFFAPNDPDHYLSRLYGDYMKLPDLDKLEMHLNKIEFSHNKDKNI